MLARIQNAIFNTETGEVQITLATSTTTGYQNTVTQYTTPGIIAMPNVNQVPNIDVQALTQVQITGYSNSIIDPNYTITNGEITNYSSNWYNSTRDSGIEMQEAQTPNKENAMMGQSTNSVLNDIMNLLIGVVTYLQTIETTFNTHTHSNSAGTTSVAAPQLTTPPDDSTVSQDQTYIQGNKNLAITGTYEPK